MKIDGRAIAEEIYKELKTKIQELHKKGIIPCLAVILVGENPASLAYVLQKQKNAEKIGAKVTVYKYEESATTRLLIDKIAGLNREPFIHGILIQRPLPPHIDTAKLELTTDPQKDIDGFHPDSPFTLPLPLAVMKILEKIYNLKNPKSEIRNPKQIQNTNDQNSKQFEHLDFEHSNIVSNFDIRYSNFFKWLRSQSIVVLGKGQTGGGPIINYLREQKLDPEIIDSKTTNPAEKIKNADIVISAVGKDETIKPEMLKQGVILIGVGISRGQDGKLHGDFNADAIQNLASFFTPTPGGVGPVNVAMLLKNLVAAAEKTIK